MAAHNELGKWGEDMAAAYLLEKGYSILERDWKSGHRLFGDPEEAIDYKKRRSLLSAINHYVKTHHTCRSVRFDVISVVGMIGTTPEIDHIKDVTLI